MDDSSSISSSDGSESSNSSVNINFEGPKKNKSCTDCSFLVILSLVVLSLLGFVVYCFINGDVGRVNHGYDECGYICGFKNKPTPHPPICANESDKSKTPFLFMKAPLYKILDLVNVSRKCVETCDLTSHIVFLHRCIPRNSTNDNSANTFQEISLSSVYQDLLETQNEMIILCIFAFILSHFILCMLRFVVGIVVWLILIGVVLSNLTGSIYLWLLVSWEKTDYDGNNFLIYLAFAIISTIFTLTIVLIIVTLRKRVALVVQLFKEAGKAIENMPTLLIQPIWTFTFLSITVIVCFYNVLFIESSGFNSQEPYSYNRAEAHYYEKNFIMKFTRIYNISIFFWIIQFIIACQHIVVAGAITNWYFTRNKNKLTSPLLRSTSRLFKYHMGSAACGSLIINLVKLVRFFSHFFHKICKESENKVILLFHNTFQCMFCHLHEFLQCLTRNAYIEMSSEQSEGSYCFTVMFIFLFFFPHCGSMFDPLYFVQKLDPVTLLIAIYGENFRKSGKRASDIIASNELRVSTINFVADFVLIMIKVFVVILNTIVGYVILEYDFSQKSQKAHLWVPLTIVGFFSYFVAHCFISVYEMLIDSLFVCFCEDSSLHNTTEEYFMSKELMDFVVRNQKKEDVRINRPIHSFIVI